jgi:hypothetical protein
MDDAIGGRKQKQATLFLASGERLLPLVCAVHGVSVGYVASKRRVACWLTEQASILIVFQVFVTEWQARRGFYIAGARDSARVPYLDEVLLLSPQRG